MVSKILDNNNKTHAKNEYIASSKYVRLFMETLCKPTILIRLVLNQKLIFFKYLILILIFRVWNFFLLFFTYFKGSCKGWKKAYTYLFVLFLYTFYFKKELWAKFPVAFMFRNYFQISSSFTLKNITNVSSTQNFGTYSLSVIQCYLSRS